MAANRCKQGCGNFENNYVKKKERKNWTERELRRKINHA